MPRLRSRGGLIARILLAIVALFALLVAVASWEVHRSVPTLDGEVRVPGWGAPVTISRDALGTAVVKGADRLDVARGLGFVHAQGLMHGDFYAHNILVDDDAHALLGDFGAASFLPEDDAARAEALKRIDRRASSVLIDELARRCDEPAALDDLRPAA